MSGSLDLAVVGNCQVSALIDRTARVMWMCLPRPDMDPVFGGLLGGDSPEACGSFAIELEGGAGSMQRYLHNSAVLETILHDDNGNSVRVTDFCPRFRARGRIFAHSRPCDESGLS